MPVLVVCVPVVPPVVPVFPPVAPLVEGGVAVAAVGLETGGEVKTKLYAPVPAEPETAWPTLVELALDPELVEDGLVKHVKYVSNFRNVKVWDLYTLCQC